MSKRVWGFVVLLLVLISDQLTKMWIIDNIHSSSDYIHLTSFLSITHSKNPGVSFGLLAGVAPPWALSLLAGSVVLFLSYTFYRAKHWVVTLSLGAVIGGAIGNIIDRVRFGEVTDFIYLHYKPYVWPTFNIADIGVTVGAMVFLVHAIWKDVK